MRHFQTRKLGMEDEPNEDMTLHDSTAREIK
jgi:hypothetical protein